MSGFLDDLERELLKAHPRVRRVRRRVIAGRASMSLALLAVVALAGAFVLSVGRERSGDNASRPAGADPGPAPAPLPSTPPATPAEPMPSLPPDSVAVLAGTDRPGVAAVVARAIRARYDVGFIGASARRDGTRTVVFHAPAFRRAAELIAMDLGASLTTIDRTARDAARGAQIVVETGRDIRGAAVGALVRPRDGAALGELATLRYADRTVVTINAQLAPGRRYAVWTTGLGVRPRFVGFVPEVRSNRRIAVTFPVPISARDRRLIVTRQRSARRPSSVGPTVLTAEMPR